MYELRYPLSHAELDEAKGIIFCLFKTPLSMKP
jgi:hypothetical protein